MILFAFPTEIRLKIYSELLVHRGPISFPVTTILLPLSHQGDLSHWLRPKVTDLCPTLLRASKQVYREAISLLYSDNCFQFSERYDMPTTVLHTIIGVFFRVIGAQASLLRHVCIEFPTATDDTHDSGLQEVRLINLDLLREACPDLTTLELSMSWQRVHLVLRNSPVSTTKLLDLIDTRLKAFRSLREVRVHVLLLSRTSDEESGDETEDPRDLTRQLCSRGWAVNITKVPPKIPDHVMIESDDDDDYYDDSDEYEQDIDRYMDRYLWGADEGDFEY